MIIATGLALTTSLFAPAAWEAPPAPFQTQARPFDGETVNANPPCFVYPAKQPAAAYVIECGTDAAFTAEHTQRWTSRYLLAVPREPLLAGRYYWRVRPGAPGDGGSDWSAVRAFTVLADAPVVPFPDVAALARRMGTSHPRVAVTAAQLAETRRRALERFGPDWLKRLKERAEAARVKPLLPEPEFLPATQDTHRIEVYQRIFQTTRPFFSEMRGLAEDYLLSGHEPSGLEAKRRLLHILSWNPRGSTCLNHNDEPATEVIRYSGTVMDWIQPLLTPAEKQRCLDSLLVRLDELRQRWRTRPFEMYPYESHNMGYYLPDAVQACLALAGDAPVEEMLEYTLLQLWSPYFPPYGGADGGWCEGPSYWTWSTSVFAYTYRLVELATGIPVHRRSNVRNMPYYKLYGNPPYARMSPFGDGQEGAAIGGGTMRQLAVLYDNPYANWYADQQRAELPGLTGLVFDPGKLGSRAPDDLPQGRAFFDVGLAAMHSVLSDPASNVQVLLRSSPFGSISHAFADQNAFTLDAYGEPLLIASGYYQLYGHPHHREWTWQTKAANSVLVNGQGQNTRDWKAQGRLLRFHTTAAGDLAVGDAGAAYGGRLTRFIRQVVFLRPLHTGGEPITVIRDTLAAPQPATWQFLLHALERMAVDADHQRVEVARGGARCRVDFLAPAGLRFEQTDQFPVAPFKPSPNQWHLTASTVAPAATCESVMVLQPCQAGGEGELLQAALTAGEAGQVLRLDRGGRVIEVRFGAVDAGGGAVTSATRVDGRVRSELTFTAGPPAAMSRSEVGGRVYESTDGPSGPVVGATPSGAAETSPTLRMDGGAPVACTVTRHDWVQRVLVSATAPGPTQLRQVAAVVDNPGDGPLVLTLPGESRRQVLPAHSAGQRLTFPVMGVGHGQRVTLAADESRGGRLALRELTANRAFGANLVPNASFEEQRDGVPHGWSAGTIDKGAQATISCVRGGHTGERCLQVTCTAATGGYFGAYALWPGVAASEAPRRFRLSCWVRSPADAEAGVQVCSSAWTFWQNAPWLRDKAQWTETAVEFTLPAGVELTHLRLHLTATRVGATLLVDDVSLVELPERP